MKESKQNRFYQDDPVKFEKLKANIASNQKAIQKSQKQLNLRFKPTGLIKISQIKMMKKSS